MSCFSSRLSPGLALHPCTQTSLQRHPGFRPAQRPLRIRGELLPEVSRSVGQASPRGRVSEIKGCTFPRDLFPQAPVSQMYFAGKAAMFLRELIGLAVLISSLETCIQQLYTRLISHKMQLTGVIVTRCVKVGRRSCTWKASPVL